MADVNVPVDETKKDLSLEILVGRQRGDDDGTGCIIPLSPASSIHGPRSSSRR